MKEKIEHIVLLAEKTIEPDVVKKLETYIELILDWNDKINLVSRKDTENMFEQHLAPCLVYFLLGLFTDEDLDIVDIGSGGGFPGIVNAITHPNKQFTLIDARQKKVNVLTDIIAQLQLNNCKAIWGRCEELFVKKEFSKKFDICTSRGVGSMKKIIPISIPFLKENGLMLAMKGGDMTEEFSEIKRPTRFVIEEYEMDQRFHYLERYQTLKIIELGKSKNQ